MTRFKLLYFLFCLLFFLPLYGSQPYFRHYTVENGLSGNAIQCLLQDRTGYIWCGTDDGLNRFDSRHFKTFRHIPGDTGSLGNNTIHSLLEDTRGTLWIGTGNGVFRYNASLEKFSAFPFPDTTNHLAQNIIYGIQEDHRGNIWFTIFGNGLFRFDPTTGETRHYLSNANDEGSLVSNLTTKLLVDREGELWIATHDKGICKYNPYSDTFAPIETRDAQSGRKARRIYALCEDSFGNIWFGDNGLYKYNKTTRSCTAFPPAGPDPLQYVHYMTEVQPGVLLIGSNNGLTRYISAENTFSTISYNILYPEGLSDLVVYSILQDREGGIWVGTHSGGLNYLSPGSSWFELYTYTSDPTSSPGKLINAFCENPDGNIWIGTDERGLWSYNPHSKTFTPVRLEHNNNRQSIHALMYDRNELWIGTYAQGVFRLNTSTGKITHYFGRNEKGLTSTSIYSIYKDSSGKIWLGTQTGIYLYQADPDSFTTIADLGFNSYITDITEDAHQTLWFASQGKGLISYNLKTDSLQFHSNAKTGLPLSITCLCPDHGKLRIGTAGYGLYTYYPENNSFVRHPDPIFQIHPTLQCIIENNNELWISGNTGLLRYTTTDETISLYTREDGLLCIPFNGNTGLKSSNGQIYLGGSDGFHVFHSQNIRKNEVIPSVVFTAFRLFNQDVQIGEHSVLQAQIDKQRHVTLAHDEAVFSIEFVTTSYCAPGKNRYKYRLEGFDKGWTDTDNRNNNATYTNLSPGEYTFQVMACNNDGVWNPEKAEIRIVILPPWWTSGWMLVVYGIVLVLLVISGYIVLLQRTNRRHQNKIKTLHQENERKLLDTKIRFFTNITHEIRTPVSLILAPVEEIMRHKNIPEAIRNDLEVVERNSERLLDLTNQILDFTKAEQEAYTSQNTTFDLRELIAETIQRFTPAAQQKGIRLNTEYPDDRAIPVCTDREALTKVLSNLLTNAMKFTRDQICVSTEVNQTENSLTIQVEDNGIGIKPEEKEKIFQLFYQADTSAPLPVKGFGIGLAIVNLLVKRMMGQIQVESEENRYTRFRVILPLREEALLWPGPTDSSPQEKTIPVRPAEPASQEEISPIAPLQKDLPITKDKKSGTVLIVEDNEEFISYLSRVIGQKYHIHTAGNGKEALQLLEELKPDIIISDVMMPVMDGVELCRHIKQDITLSHIPVILLTARTDTDTKIAGLENGADVYIEKPVSVSYLYAQMVSLLENRNKLRRLFSEKPFTPIHSITESQADEKWLLKLNEVIQENLSNTDFSVDQLARSVNMSRTLLYAKVKAVTGLTPNEFIRLIRLRKAAEYLAGNEYKINEICYMVGFNSPSYFAKCFQNQFGVLPKDF